MELYKNVFQISSLYGGRYLFQYLFAGKRLVLLDSGIADTPRSAILPFIDSLGIDPARLSMLITTHPDTDHQGGNAAIRKAAPNALVACGESDRRLVQDPANLYAERYNYLKNEHGLAVADEPSPDAGSYCRIDIGLGGGEKISLAMPAPAGTTRIQISLLDQLSPSQRESSLKIIRWAIEAGKDR